MRGPGPGANCPICPPPQAALYICAYAIWKICPYIKELQLFLLIEKELIIFLIEKMNQETSDPILQAVPWDGPFCLQEPH
uniref:Uncharacterized protein n=1 Tax=Gopherus evgoodei TaxID=1825980 RepID=A0A8C4VSX8_9SAUR